MWQKGLRQRFDLGYFLQYLLCRKFLKNHKDHGSLVPSDLSGVLTSAA